MARGECCWNRKTHPTNDPSDNNLQVLSSRHCVLPKDFPYESRLLLPRSHHTVFDYLKSEAYNCRVQAESLLIDDAAH